MAQSIASINVASTVWTFHHEDGSYVTLRARDFETASAKAELQIEAVDLIGAEVEWSQLDGTPWHILSVYNAQGALVGSGYLAQGTPGNHGTV